MLYGQLHEGLHYEIMRAPGVTGVDSYNVLCIAAKSEERRLQELKKRQQYGKVSIGSKPPARSSLTSKNTSNSAPRDVVVVGLAPRSVHVLCVKSLDTYS